MGLNETTWSCHFIEEGRELELLFKAALRGLAEEDASLARAFSQGMLRAGEFYTAASQGLAYWVGETQLVYQVYKAWIPLVRVRWEAPDPVYLDTTKRADLAVFGDAPSAKVKWVFEAKWWNQNSQTSTKQHQALDRDVNKLLSTTPSGGRFLLAFWWATATTLPSDCLEVEQYCQGSCSQESAMVTPVFLGSFHTDWTPDKGKSRVVDGLFVLAALKVDHRQ